MVDLKVTSKGQVTLKKDVLQHLGVKPGDRIEVELLPEGRVSVRALSERNGKMSDFFGIIPRSAGKQVSLDDIEQAIADGWAGKVDL